MGRQLSVIIAEDKTLDREKIEQYSHDLGLNVVSSVASGEWFIDECMKYEPDIVLLNIGLNGIDGLSAYRTVQERGIKSQLIMVTGTKDPNLILAGLRLNCLDFINKPVNYNRLSEAVEKARRLIEKDLLISKSSPGRIIHIKSNHRSTYINENNLIYAHKIKGEHKTIVYIEGENEKGLETKMSLSEIQNQCSENIFSANQSNLINVNFIQNVYASENFMGSYIIRLKYKNTEIDLPRRNKKMFDLLYIRRS